MKICLIVVNYNGINFLPKYLDKIINECNIHNINLLVTDDNSTDQSALYIQDKNVAVTINNKKNHGFAANLNHGILFSKSIDDFDYFLISNNDIEFANGFFNLLNKVLNYLKSEYTNIGLIGFQEINQNDDTNFKNYNYENFDSKQISICSEIPGFFFLISKELLNTIGYFNEEYFMYGEDNDYFYRAKSAGYLILNTNIPVMHYSEGSATNHKLTSWYVYRNMLLFAQNNLNFFKTLKLLCAVLNIIYNPFYKVTSPSANRIKRNGFFYNNYLLLKSIVWNLKYLIKKKNNE
jgi:GT2 family glycosyltransferase